MFYAYPAVQDDSKLVAEKYSIFLKDAPFVTDCRLQADRWSMLGLSGTVVGIYLFTNIIPVRNEPLPRGVTNSSARIQVNGAMGCLLQNEMLLKCLLLLLLSWLNDAACNILQAAPQFCDILTHRIKQLLPSFFGHVIGHSFLLFN